MLWVGVASAAVLLGSWYYAAVKPPKPRLCGSPGGPPVTASRIRLRDGRYLAYNETGVPKDQAQFKIIFCHGFGGSRLDVLRASPELMEELGVYMVAFDRPGYAESDPDPRRSPKSAALDIEELADTLELGPKFYLISFSLGGHAAWASLKYIPKRLAGVALLAPVINYRWPGFPKGLSQEFYKKQDIGDQWTLRISYYAPWLLHWWINQSWLPSSTVIKGTTKLPNRLDRQIHDTLVSTGAFLKRRELATQQSLQESYLWTSRSHPSQSISGRGMRMGSFQLVCSVISAAASAGSSTMSSRQLGTTFQGYLGLLIVFLKIFCMNRSP